MDWEVIAQKLESLRRALHRVETRCPDSVDALLEDYDAQDILALNLTRAVQVCVDIGASMASTLEFSPPDTMGELFDRLSEVGVIAPDLALRMKKAVGFRNFAVHNYEAINWAIVYAIARNHTTDFQEFARAVIAFRDRELQGL